MPVRGMRHFLGAAALGLSMAAVAASDDPARDFDPQWFVGAGTAECLSPDPCSPFWQSDDARFNWTMLRRTQPDLQAELNARESSRQAANTSRRETRDRVHREATAEAESQMRRSQDVRHAKKLDFLERESDRRLCIESKYTLDHGRRAVNLEPPSSPSWCSAPPHLVSHWRTINERHDDPPRAHPERMITCYRRLGPHHNSERPPTPPSPRWGGGYAPLSTPAAEAAA